MAVAKIQSFEDYVQGLLSAETEAVVLKSNDWQHLEPVLGRIFFGLARYFAPPFDEEDAVQDRDAGFLMGVPQEARASGTEHVRYVAVNFRGLYQRNGRETLLDTFGSLRSQTSDPLAHYRLHSCYMESLSRKSESINQLFLATTRLKSIAVEFVSMEFSQIEIEDGTHARIYVGQDLANLWDTVKAEWCEVRLSVLQDSDSAALRSLATERLKRTYATVSGRVHQLSAELLTTPFFSQWYAMPHDPPVQGAFDAVERFNRWLLCLCWLAFYCCEDHAGNYFYSVRLPHLIAEPPDRSVIPRSSMSVVSSKELSDKWLDEWRTSEDIILANAQFKIIREHAGSVFNEYKSQRQKSALGQPREDGVLITDLIGVSPTVTGGSPNLAADYDKVKFLLKMSRLLVQEKHEGSPVRFCFIFGFSWERVDAECRGALADIEPLRNQWKVFLNKIIQSSAQNQYSLGIKELVESTPDTGLPILASGMAKWIKTGDLTLQPWDTALFFEEDRDDRFPVPTSVVRIYSSGRLGRDPVASEFQLRGALRSITRDDHSPGTVAVLVGDTGMTLFVRGKAIFLPCHAGTQYDSSLSVRLWEGKADCELFEEYMEQQLSFGKFSPLKQEVRNRASNLVRRLCEALVCSGHGAMFVIPPPDEGGACRLAPLGPAWTVRPELGEDATDCDILLVALMAALDGATQIDICNAESGKDIRIYGRKCILPKEEVWAIDGDTDTVLSEDFNGNDPLEFVGKGTRHHSALAFSIKHQDFLVLTVSADGPVNVWQNGKRVVWKVWPKYIPRFRP